MIFQPFKFRMHKQETLPALILGVILVLAGTFVYANTLDNSFIWDDILLIKKNPDIQNPLNILRFFSPKYWKTEHPFRKNQLYRPTRTISFALDYQIWGLNPGGFHLTNLILHLANTLLVFLYVHILCTRIYPEKSNIFIAFFGALFFCLHPALTEAVSWIKNRSELISCFFLLICLLAFPFPDSTRKAQKTSIRYILSLLAFMLGLFSKETAIAAPVLILLSHLVIFQKTYRTRYFLRLFPFFVIAILYFAFRFSASQEAREIHQVYLDGYRKGNAVMALLEAKHMHIHSPDRPYYEDWYAGFKVTGLYQAILLFPKGQSPYRVFSYPNRLLHPDIFLASLIFLVMLWLALFPDQYRRLCLFGFLWLLICLLPVAGVGWIPGRTVAEQRLYIPGIGFAIMVSIFFMDIKHSISSGMGKKAGALFLAVPLSFAAVYGASAMARNRIWDNPVRFWTDSVQKTPFIAECHNNLGINLAMEKRYNLALVHFHKAISLDPGYESAWFNLGVNYSLMGNLKKSIYYMEKALRIKPDYQYCKNQLEKMKQQFHGLEKKEKQLLRLTRLQPDDWQLLYLLGETRYAMGKTDSAIEAFESCVKRNPGFEKAWWRLALLYREKGECETALNLYSVILKRSENTDIYYPVACLHALLGEKEKYQKWAEKAVAAGFPEWAVLEIEQKSLCRKDIGGKCKQEKNR